MIKSFFIHIMMESLY